MEVGQTSLQTLRAQTVCSTWLWVN